MPASGSPRIIVTGVPRTLRKLDAATADATVKRGLEAGMNVLRLALKKYPAPPAGSTYVRTLVLGKSWAQSTSGYAMKAEGWVGNNVSYARYVQDKALQARVHQGRWQTVQSVADDKGDEVADVIAEEIEDAMGERL